MTEERKPLLEQLRDRILFFKERRTVGMIKTEHAVFIPTQLMLNSSKETEQFIVAAREIGKMEELNCPVAAEKANPGVPGIEFVFEFSSATDFDGIVSEIDNRLEQEPQDD